VRAEVGGRLESTESCWEVHNFDYSPLGQARLFATNGSFREGTDRLPRADSRLSGK
jgi:hypothetical protein